MEEERRSIIEQQADPVPVPVPGTRVSGAQFGDALRGHPVTDLAGVDAVDAGSLGQHAEERAIGPSPGRGIEGVGNGREAAILHVVETLSNGAPPLEPACVCR